MTVDSPPPEWAVELVLGQSSIAGSERFLRVTFYFAQLDPGRYDCTLTTIEEKGKPVAEGSSTWPKQCIGEGVPPNFFTDHRPGMEFTFIPTVVNEDGFTTGVCRDNEWRPEKQIWVRVDDYESDDEVMIKLKDCVLKSAGGEYMARATIEGSGELLSTENWR